MREWLSGGAPPAKEGVAGSIPVSRFLKPLIFQGFFYFILHFMLHQVVSCNLFSL